MRIIYVISLLLGDSTCEVIRHLPRGFSIISPVPNKTQYTDVALLSLSFEGTGFILGRHGEFICATVDQSARECFEEAGGQGFEDNGGFSVQLRPDVLSSGTHTIRVEVYMNNQEYSTDFSFTSARFESSCSSEAGQRAEPRIIVDAFPFFDEISTLELRLEEIGEIVDVIVVAESPMTHSFKDKPSFLTKGMSESVTIKKWAHKIRVVSLDASEVHELHARNDSHSHEVLQRDILAPAIAQILQAEYGIDEDECNNDR